MPIGTRITPSIQLSARITLLTPGQHFTYLIEHRPKTPPQRRKLCQRLFQHAGEAQEAQRVPCGCRVKDDDAVLHTLDMLHDLGKAHGFVYSRNRKCEVLHHGRHGAATAALGIGLFNHLLDAAGGVDLHGAKVVESIDFSGLLAKLLPKCIAEIVRRIRADQEDALADLGHLHGQGARRRGLAHTTLAAAKDPLECRLIEYVLHCGRQRVLHDSRRRHGGQSALCSVSARWQ